MARSYKLHLYRPVIIPSDHFIWTEWTGLAFRGVALERSLKGRALTQLSWCSEPYKEVVIAWLDQPSLPITTLAMAEVDAGLIWRHKCYSSKIMFRNKRCGCNIHWVRASSSSDDSPVMMAESRSIPRRPKWLTDKQMKMQASAPVITRTK